VDGVLAISRALEHFVATRSKAPIRLTGFIVDLDPHPMLPPLPLTKSVVVGYAGSLSESKDGVLTLLRAAARARDELSREIDLRVHILGGPLDSAEGRAVIRESEALGLEGNVVFHGLVPHDQVGKYLADCHILALPRPASRQANGGLPTKLGEYLSTGRIVVTTNVGDIPRYLRHHDSCVMITPNDVSALSGAFVGIAHDYDFYQQVGARGRTLVEQSFAASEQVGYITSFILELKDGPQGGDATALR
jgi:glycosyltransferase involved in cell wall biosynthesis